LHHARATDDPQTRCFAVVLRFRKSYPISSLGNFHRSTDRELIRLGLVECRARERKPGAHVFRPHAGGSFCSQARHVMAEQARASGAAPYWHFPQGYRGPHLPR
jgi:hypothetical protein